MMTDAKTLARYLLYTQKPPEDIRGLTLSFL